ncbi:MAG: two-component regulator propeller domain-containing protein, partial [Lentimicrobiaceae bacterium]|nr:two-component regulator propeller domain-containing protein [Lentimicrobiaceae bacterium]
MFQHLLFIFLPIVLSCNLAAQELHYDHYTVRDGLLQMQVTTLFQDSKGHLWIGTKLGASRFDGKHFKNYTIEDGLPESFVHNITEDSLGRILLLTPSGLMIVDGDETSSFPTSIFKTRIGLFNPVIKHKDSIFIYKTNIESQLEGYYFDGSNYSLMETYFPPIPHFPESYFYETISMNFDHQSNTLYAGSGKWGIHAIKDGQMSKVADIREAVQTFSRGMDGELYVGYDSHFGKLEGDSLVKLYSDVIPITHLTNTNFVVDQDARIIYRENDTQRLVIIDNDQVFKETFNHGIITALLLDREGNLWIGTEKGLYKNTSRAILNFIPGDGRINEYIWSISEDRNGAMLFASVEYGLQKFKDNAFTTLSNYKSLSKNNKQMNFYMGSLRTSNGDVYLPVTDIVALRYDGTSFYSDIPFEVSNVAFTAYEDPDDASIFFGTHYGLFNLSNGLVQRWDVQPGYGKSRSVTAVVKDSSKRIWIGGFNGISILENNEIKHLPNKELDFEHGANAMLRDSLSNIWIGNPHGLFLYDYQGFHPVEHPLLNKLVLSLAMVGDSNLLIGTISDLLLLDVKTYYQTGEVKVMHIGPDKGYHAIEPGQNGFYRDTKGYYWLTNSDRVIRIDPAKLATNPIPPTIYIRSVSLMDDRMNWNPLSGDQLKNPVFYYAQDEKNLRFEFTAVSLRDSRGVSFSHFLDGYDKGWSVPDQEHTAIYTNLQPGNYTLYFKAANSDGVWSEEQIFRLEIRPSFYQTFWFKMMIIVLMAGMLFSGGIVFTNQRRKKLMKQQENERKFAELQLL